MIYNDFLINVAITISLSVLYGIFIRKIDDTTTTGKIAAGIIFGIAAIIVMFNPFHYMPGIIFDSRSIVISAAGLFGGFIPAIIASSIAAAYRLHIGGAGTLMGVSVIFVSAAIGLGYKSLAVKKPEFFRPVYFYVFGVTVHLFMLLLMLTLPGALVFDVIKTVAVPVMIIFPLTTLLLCILLRDHKIQTETSKALVKSEEQYRLIVETANEGIWRMDRNSKTVYMNRMVSAMLGYTEAEIAGRPVSDFMFEEDLVDHKSRMNCRYTGKADIYERKLKRKDGSILWAGISAIPLFDENKRFDGSFGMLTDITSRKEAEEELKQTTEKLRTGLIGTINVISLTIETRDPYTSGHQKRVSKLARLIAQEIGLPNDTVENIRMAGVVHDIGKMSVPSEILSKPSRLTDIEMRLIKTHPASGYEILKDACLPYPIAEIVLQHHERIDGSGYPNCLEGEQILLEAKIISVADVVEAISSHRPYRPAFGVDIALEEIRKNRGILYDAKVVDACLRLFNEKGFKFE
ncbi:MAG: PAS domain S-box protein [Desulfobacterium sp.]|nr:PAS domain S-box protein [Desulfobacterium sp.]MBU4010057.1 PAS domain S-box protein [Pseudomonadota bacterium]MBU4037540.1 PAS domain S-box protein [Pseudomonadota bacterium]